MCAWAKNGTPNTLSSSGDTMSISDITSKKFNVLLGHVWSTGGDINRLSRFNADGGNNYANRYSSNGGADATSTSGPNMFTNSTGPQLDEFGIAYFVDISGEEKLLISFGLGLGGAGAANDPDRRETVAKYDQTGSLTSIDCLNSDTGDWASGSNISALGTD